MIEAHVQVLAISTRGMLSMRFPDPTGSSEAGWQEIAYDNALKMLDPA